MVDFEREDNEGWLFLCGACLGQAAGLIRGTVPRTELEKSEKRVNELERARVQAVERADELALRLARVEPELARAVELREMVESQKASLLTSNEEMAAKVHRFERGIPESVGDALAADFAAGASEPEPAPAPKPRPRGKSATAA